MNCNMDFNEIIEGLYCEDEDLICDVLNQGVHVKELNAKDMQRAIHTGFYYKTHKDTLFEVLYIIPMHILCFQKPTSFHFRNIVKKWGLRIPMACTNSYYEFDDVDLKDQWYNSYDIQTGDFQHISINSFERDEQHFVDKIILSDGKEENSFTMIDSDEQHTAIYHYYPLRPDNISQLFRGRNGFEPMNSNNGSEKSNDDIRTPSYGKYRGTYAQDVAGYDDDFIDDVLDGHPDAYWNID